MPEHPPPAPVTLHLNIHGRVQGVFYRDSMRREALALGITGWVRNLGDGTVEAMIQGVPDKVEALLAWSRQGPPRARVDGVASQTAEGHFDTFEILY